MAISENSFFQLRFSSIFISRFFTDFLWQSLFPLSFNFNGIFVGFLDYLNKTAFISLTIRQTYLHLARLLDFSGLG